jgi:NodT family efflux transporter outer membrane factor (OMF) lipoprotein
MRGAAGGRRPPGVERRRRRQGVVFVAGLALGGCAVGPNFHHPAEPATDHYTVQPLPAAPTTKATPAAPAAAAAPSTPEASAAPAAPTAPTAPAAPTAPTAPTAPARADDTAAIDRPGQQFVVGQDLPPDWWKRFGSRELDALVDKALHANPNVQAAEASLRQANEYVAAQRGAYFPTVQASFAGSRNRNAVQVLAPTLTSGAATFNLFTPQLSVSYVPDLLGGNRRQVEALQAQADASRFEYDAAYITLAANVVSAAVQEAGLRAQIEATQQVIALEVESLAVMRRELELGAIAESDVLAQEAALAQVEATLPPLQKSLDQQHDMLAALTGQLPSETPVSDIRLDQLTLPMAIPIGVPAQLVERRPDVRAAEAQLHAATAEVGVAMANMLPQITLTAALGNTSTNLSSLFSSATEFWSAGASLTQTLFAGGTLYHRERAARAGLDVAGAQYRAAVLTAFQNVADSLRALAADQDEVQAEDHAYDASLASLQIARRQVELGAVSYLALLNAQQTYQQAVIGRAQALANRYADTAALFEALGGSAPGE